MNTECHTKGWVAVTVKVIMGFVTIDRMSCRKMGLLSSVKVIMDVS